jgi:hypothetical protein
MAYGSLKVDSLTTSTQTVSIDDLLSSSDIGASVQAYDADTAKTDVVQSFSKAQRGSVVALTTVSGTVTPDFSLGNNFSLTLSAATTIANPTNLVAGQSGVIVITQASGSPYSLSWGTNWKWVGGSAPDATQTASAVDVLTYYVESASRISARLLSDLKATA